MLNLFELIKAKKNAVKKLLNDKNIEFTENEIGTKLSFPIALGGAEYGADIYFVGSSITPIILNSKKPTLDPISALSSVKNVFLQNGANPMSDNTNHTYGKYEASFSKDGIGATVYAEKSDLMHWSYRIILTNHNIKYDKKPAIFLERLGDLIKASKMSKARKKFAEELKKHSVQSCFFVTCTASKGHGTNDSSAALSIVGDTVVLYELTRGKLSSTELSAEHLDTLTFAPSVTARISDKLISFSFENADAARAAIAQLDPIMKFGAEFAVLKKKISEIVLDYDPNSLHALRGYNFDDEIDLLAKRLFKNSAASKDGIRTAISASFSDIFFAAELADIIYSALKKQ